ncbi:SCO family protein [Novosphingobium sp. FKTRR1]|uniref:SCO family protein n=1 Tax=Novosphingobium sp. FKTRR1 TaxID=2879118 RepID=UPI001CF08190|nr:SCO family protein [Novosphingobium sp. FKTRR1]
MNRSAMHPFSTVRHAVIATALAVAPVLAASMLLSACSSGTATLPAPLEGAAIGGPFTLTDQTGKTVTEASFAGKYRVFYFGYTYCPDVCPLDVQHLMQGYHAFAKAHADLAAKVVPVFISIDPARDTPQAVGQFTANFGRELVGLTGTPEQVAAVAKAYAVYYKKHDEDAAGNKAANGAYLMDHSRAAYLMGPDGKPIALLPVEQNGPAVAAELAKWVR